MKTWKASIALAVLIGLVGLAVAYRAKEKPGEISTTSTRAEAAQNYNEAEFATQIRDHPRAEGLLARAVELDSEEPNYWIQLGACRKRLGNRPGAKKAYEKARDLLQAAYRRDKNAPDPLFAEMEVCVLLGRPDEAKRIYEKALQDHASDPQMKNFAQNRLLDALLAAPTLKEMSL